MMCLAWMTPATHVRASLQKHRRRSPQGGRLHHGAGLHRADLLAALPEIPRRPGAGSRARSATGGENTHSLLENDFPWQVWDLPKKKDGTLDHDAALTGDDLREFVSGRLFPYLTGFKQKAAGPDTLEYKIGEIFGEINNKISSGYNLRDIIDAIDGLRFRSQSEKHELSALYEEKIKRMGNAGRNGGEYYTPRPLIRAMIRVVQPKLGETIYDGACGSAASSARRWTTSAGRTRNAASPRIRHCKHARSTARKKSLSPTSSAS